MFEKPILIGNKLQSHLSHCNNQVGNCYRNRWNRSAAFQNDIINITNTANYTATTTPTTTTSTSTHINKNDSNYRYNGFIHPNYLINVKM